MQLHERRPDMRKEKISAGRSINLAISERGLYALEQVGLKDKVLEKAISMRGRMIHTVAGETTFQRYGKNDTQCINSISRGELNKVLMTAAEALGVQIFFNKNATGLEMGEWGTPLFGTDGASSVVRQALIKKGICTESQEILDYGYKELTIPAGPNGAFVFDKNALHIWPRGTFMLIALPNFDGSYTCTLFLPHKSSGNISSGTIGFETTGFETTSFENLKNPEQVTQFFKAQFPDALPFIENLTEQFFTNPVGRMVTVRASPWNYKDEVLLLGDAAHAIVPFFGQGMNCGFEDCTILDEMIEKTGRPVQSLFADFSRIRKKDSDAIADLALENFIEMRDKVGKKEFLLMKEVESILQNEFSGRYISRYSLVTFSRTPYSQALAIGHIHNEILGELCRGLNSAKEVNLQRAEELINEKLSAYRD